jgi:hypothetical protein
MDLKNEYFNTIGGQLGYNYYDLPGVKGQGYGFEDLDEKQQPTDKEMYKTLLKTTAILRDKAKKESKANKQHNCIYCDVTNKKRQIETHLFKKHTEELRSDLQKYLDNRKILIAPFCFTPKKGKSIFFCLPCKKFWLEEGDAISHNKTCNIDDQKQAIYDLAMSDNIFVPKIPNDAIKVDAKPKTKTELSKEYWDKQRETRKILKDELYADSLESVVDKTNHKLYLERIKKLEQDNKELKEENGKLKEDKPKLEKIYYEKKIAIQKATFEDMMKGLLVRMNKNKALDKLMNEIEHYIDKYDYNTPDFEALTYAKDIAKLGKEEHLKIKIDLSDLKSLDLNHGY